METKRLSEIDVRRELSEFRDRYPKRGDDALFMRFPRGLSRHDRFQDAA